MTVYRASELQPDLFKRPVLTIGNFDGMHRGHQRVVNQLLTEAEKLNTRSVALTFEPHPVKVLNPDKDLKLIYPYAERIKLLSGYGVDDIVILTFDKKLASLKAETFVSEILVGLLDVQKIIVGYDFNFGRHGDGDAQNLLEIAKLNGYQYDVEQMGVYHIDGEIVSSSHIRQHLMAGDVARVAKLLGRPFHLQGQVIRGAGRGKIMGYPTANLSVQQELLPKIGVYLGRARIGDKTYNALVNVGKNPTFGLNPITVESFILDFTAQIYDSEIEFLFLDRLRDEIRFAGAEELVRQMDHDLGQAKSFFSCLDKQKG